MRLHSRTTGESSPETSIDLSMDRINGTVDGPVDRVGDERLLRDTARVGRGAPAPSRVSVAVDDFLELFLRRQERLDIGVEAEAEVVEDLEIQRVVQCDAHLAAGFAQPEHEVFLHHARVDRGFVDQLGDLLVLEIDILDPVLRRERFEDLVRIRVPEGRERLAHADLLLLGFGKRFVELFLSHDPLGDEDLTELFATFGHARCGSLVRRRDHPPIASVRWPEL